VHFHSSSVNPCELIISNNFFQTLVQEVNIQKAPLTKHYLVLTQYTTQNARASSAGPSCATLLETTNLQNFAKEKDQVDALEARISEVREKCLAILEKAMTPAHARVELVAYVGLIIRCIFAKSWPSDLKPPFGTGKYTPAKAQQLGVFWAKSIESKYPNLNFPMESGFVDLEEKKEDEEEFDLRCLKRKISEPKTPVAETFKRGDLVTVRSRMTRKGTTLAGETHRKDINVGTEGAIEGWADVGKQLVLFKFSQDLGDGPQQVTHQCKAEHLQLTSEYVLAQASASSDQNADAPSEKLVP